MEAVGGEVEGHALGPEQGDVLLGQGVARLDEDALEVGLVQRPQLDPDGEPALELGDEVAGPGYGEGAGGDEEDVVGVDRAVAGVDRRALEDGQEVALDALPADVGAVL